MLLAGLPTDSGAAGNETKESENIRVLTSTFPIYQFTRNITQGSTLLDVELMLPSQLGCPHDYALTPQDLFKLEQAQVFIVNGLGLEEFLGPPLHQANPQLRVIDSSSGITGILNYGGEAEGEQHGHGAGHAGAPQHAKHAEAAHGEHGHLHEEGHSHDSGPNPHLFASPRMAALQVMNIAQSLAAVAPAEKELYERNAQAYVQRLRALNEEFQALGKRLANTRIVTQHGVFDYLARDMGLDVVAVIAAHPGQEPAAAELLELVRTIKVKKAGALFIEPQYPDSIGKTIARESGIALALLDPVATGPQQAPLDYYESTMRTNLTTLADTLGLK
ncbi:MAG: zinc ABC transporter solute-binding protein [Desulfobulbaceae bacterium]|nr:zinc ABC transporter solute-binding protein [Desulfobulbaceae bacterium]